MTYMRVVFLLVIGVAGTGVLLWLGFWQVQRLDWKESVLAEIEARISDAPVAVPAAPDEARDRYLAVEAAGELAEEELHVLVSAKGFGAGYRVIRALDLGDRRVLVDLGLIRTEDKGVARPGGPVGVRGNLHWPEEVDSFTPENDVAGNIWFAREVPVMAAALGTDPVMIIAAEVTPPVPGVTAFPVDTSGIPNDHLGYAVTWFGLAAVWLSMTALFLYRGRRTSA
ncbi:MAG: SURF1 family protein [Pseudomonadota bacterium]